MHVRRPLRVVALALAPVVAAGLIVFVVHAREETMRGATACSTMCPDGSTARKTRFSAKRS